MKTVLLSPGFRDGINSRDYRSVIKAIEGKGYKVVFIPIIWKHTDINDWVAQLEAEYDKYQAADTILAGFSYGSMTSFVAAARRNPAELWLFSFSPYFAEDIPHIKKWWANTIGKRRIASFQRLSFDETVKAIKCPTIIMLGETEVKRFGLLTNRCKQAHRAIKNSKFIVVPNAGHDVADKDYVESIKAAV